MGFLVVALCSALKSVRLAPYLPDMTRPSNALVGWS